LDLCSKTSGAGGAWDVVQLKKTKEEEDKARKAIKSDKAL